MSRMKVSGWEPEVLDRRTRRESAERIANERRARLIERQGRIDAIRKAHAQAFAAPLIDAKLLTPTERAEIQASVINVQPWHSPLAG